MDTRSDTNTVAQQWFLLVDPAWQPRGDEDLPPIEAVVGLWPVEDGGTLGRFRANPRHVPSDEDAPTDPLDAVLRLALHSRASAEQVQLMVRDSLFDLAMNGDGRPLILRSPDDVPCAVIATGEAHRTRVESPGWRRIDLDELVVSLADGVDVLVNPGGPAAVRLAGDFLRDTLMLEDDRVRDLYARETAGVRVVSWKDVDVPGQG
ncbi:type VII secretion system-associated protein [Lentzea sp. NPDC055074]